MSRPTPFIVVWRQLVARAPSSFFVGPKAAIAAQRHLLLTLGFYWRDEAGCVWPKPETVATGGNDNGEWHPHTSDSERTVRSAITRAVAGGWIRREARKKNQTPLLYPTIPAAVSLALQSLPGAQLQRRGDLQWLQGALQALQPALQSLPADPAMVADEQQYEHDDSTAAAELLDEGHAQLDLEAARLRAIDGNGVRSELAAAAESGDTFPSLALERLQKLDQAAER